MFLFTMYLCLLNGMKTTETCWLGLKLAALPSPIWLTQIQFNVWPDLFTADFLFPHPLPPLYIYFYFYISPPPHPSQLCLGHPILKYSQWWLCRGDFSMTKLSSLRVASECYFTSTVDIQLVAFLTTLSVRDFALFYARDDSPEIHSKEHGLIQI